MPHLPFLRASMTAFALAVIGLNATSPANAADYSVSVEQQDNGFCSRPAVLNKIQSKFSYQVRHVPNLPQVGIAEFRDIGTTRWLPANEDEPIGRLYCNAQVVLTDGVKQPIWYLVEEGMGFAGTGYNVEFCVNGFDRWLVYNGRCRVLR